MAHTLPLLYGANALIIRKLPPPPDVCSIANSEVDINKNEKCAIFIGFFVVSCYGHVITDNLKKLWFLQTDYSKQLLDAGYEIVYITMGLETVPHYMEELFAFAGCDVAQFRQITENEKFRDLVVPDSSLFYAKGHLSYTKEYVQTIDRIKCNVGKRYANIEVKPKIYYTRRYLKPKRTIEFNEQCVENEFSKAGYEIIAPESLSVGLCIYYAMNCSFFAASEGSVSHNILFCNKDAQCVVLKKADYKNSYSDLSDAVSGSKVEYVVAHHSSCANREEPWNGPFFFYITPQLEAFLKHKIPHKPYFLYLSFWEMQIMNNRIYRKCRKIFKKLFRLGRC